MDASGSSRYVGRHQLHRQQQQQHHLKMQMQMQQTQLLQQQHRHQQQPGNVVASGGSNEMTNNWDFDLACYQSYGTHTPQEVIFDVTGTQPIDEPWRANLFPLAQTNSGITLQQPAVTDTTNIDPSLVPWQPLPTYSTDVAMQNIMAPSNLFLQPTPYPNFNYFPAVTPNHGTNLTNHSINGSAPQQQNPVYIPQASNLTGAQVPQTIHGNQSFNQNPPFQNSLQLYPTAQEMASTQAIHQCSINGLSFPGLSPSPSEMSFPIQKSTVLQTASTKTQSPRHILHPRRKQIQSLKSQQPPPRSTPIQQEPCQPSKLTSIREMRHQKYIPGADIPELAALYKDYEEIEWTVDKIPIKWRDNSTLEEWSKDELELRHLWLSELAGTQVWEIPEEILTSMELSSYSTGEA